MNTSTEAQLPQHSALAQKILLKYAENWRLQLMCAQNSRSTTLSTRISLKESGNSHLMLCSPDLMLTPKDVMTFSISQPLSCNSINSKRWNWEAQKVKLSPKPSNKFQKSSKKQLRISDSCLTIQWISTRKNSMMILWFSDRRSKS